MPSTAIVHVAFDNIHQNEQLKKKTKEILQSSQGLIQDQSQNNKKNSSPGIRSNFRKFI